MVRNLACKWSTALGLAAVGALASTASAQITIASSATPFIDISMSGTSIGSISDDSETNVSSATLAAAGFTGNGLLGLANIRIGNNGAVLWVNTTGEVGYINSTTFPTMAANSVSTSLGNGGLTAGTQFVCPLWDDNTPGTGGSISWQVITGNLIIQWTNEDHFAASGSGVITYEMVVYGGVTIASQLPLVEFIYNDTLYAASQYQDDGGSATIGYKNWGVVAAANDVEFGNGGGNNTSSDPAFGDATMKPKVGGWVAANNVSLPHSVVIKGVPPAPPANDGCAGAFVLAATQSGDTTLANNSASSTCDATGKDVWYKYTNGPDAGTLTLDTCTSAMDAVISVYDVCGGTQLACDDNSAPCGGGAAQVALAMSANQSIVIRVSDKGTSGTFALHSSFVVPPPANDECATATVISGSGAFPADNRFATPTTATAPGSTCQSSQSRDIWFKWTSTQPGTVSVDSCGASQPASDSVITVYTGSCGSLTEIACDDDTCVTPGAASQLTFSAACATTYYIRLSNWSTTVPATAWTLNVSAPAPVDSDGDTVIDCLDGCPSDPLKTAAGVCGCGVADTDSDGDGFANCIDGCPSDPLKTAAGVCGCGVADTDSDGDGFANCIDGCPSDPLKTTPGICGCGFPDAGDADGDSVLDCVDGCPTDPTKSAPGQCGCGVADTDTDGDTVADCVDGCPTDAGKTAPGVCGCGIADTDSDGDGTPNCIDGCPADAGKIAPGVCGCGIADTDSDGDGTPNCIDGCPADAGKIAPGICGCGVADTDSDGDGTPNCNDGCPNDATKTAPGQCGCGVADTDSDGDGIADCNDPIFDEIEANDTRATANNVLLACGGAIRGTSTGTSGTGATSLDYFKVTTPVAPLGIYKRQLVITSPIAGHTGTIRGLTQSAGVISTTETAFQTSTTTPTRMNQWYGFGKGESIYYRVSGTASTTQPYTATLSCTPVTPIVTSGCVVAGPITIKSVGLTTTDTDMWLYDGNFNAIVGAGNDDTPSPSSAQSTLVRTLAPGTYYVAISNFNSGNNQASPADDNFRSGTVLDFADAFANNSTSTLASGAAGLNFSISDGTTTIPVTAAKPNAFDVVWAQFTVNSVPCTPSNDDCANAAPIGATQTGSLATATNDGSSSCDATGRDVWYSLTTTDAGTLNLDTCGSAVDTVISVFSGCPGNTLNELACNDTCGGAPCTGPSACLSLALGANQTVKIRVSDKGLGIGGAYVLNESFVVPPPANDECATATVIAGSGVFVVDNRFATPTTATAPGSACQSLQCRDVWYRWTSQGAGTVTIDTCGGPSWDSVITVYTGACGSLSEIACDDDSCTSTSLHSAVSFAAAACTSYTIRVSSYNATTGVLWQMNLTAPGAVDSDGDTVTDCFDGCPLDAGKVAPGICGCGVADTDSDGDGIANCIDGCPFDAAKTTPGVCGCGVADTDSDGDGTPNCIDGCPSDAGKTAPGQCGCGVADTDSDGDGIANCNDGCPNDAAKTAPGICGCGVSDVDSDGDGIANCNDGCPLDANKTAPGVCGCGVSDVDSDGDGTPNCNDGCPLDAGKTAPGQCGCGIADTDTDGDGVADCNDNCDTIPNPNQADCDLDGVGDVCEIAFGTASDLDGNGIPDNCQAGSILVYCSSGTSVNGCAPTISSFGTPSASQPSGFYIATFGNDGQRFGQFFYSITGAQQVPFNAGYMCVQAPRQRMGAPFTTNGTTGACNGALFIDVNVFAANNPGAFGVPLQTGLTYYFEGYNRDPGSPGTLVMSNAVGVTFTP